jgi:hypothetical protein
MAYTGSSVTAATKPSGTTSAVAGPAMSTAVRAPLLVPLQPKQEPGNDFAGDVVGADGEGSERPGVGRFEVHLLVRTHRERQGHAGPELGRGAQHRHILEADGDGHPLGFQDTEPGGKPKVAGDAAGKLGLVEDRADVEGRRQALPDAHGSIAADANTGLGFSSFPLRLTDHGRLADGELDRLPDLEDPGVNGNLLENSNGRSSAGPERVLARRGAHLLRELEERVVGSSANVQLERLA